MSGNHIGLWKKLRSSFEDRVYRLSKKRRKVVIQTKVQEVWPLEMPLVTVIIPCYNYGAYLNEAIESVLVQSLQRFEIIIIDDGSTDSFTKEVLKEISNPKVKVVRQVNQGLARTRNNGAAIASGKYLCFLDADDMIEPTYLEKTVRILESDESVGTCFSWVQCFGDRTEIWKTEDLDPVFLRRSNTASSHSVIRKAAWERVKEQNGSGFLSKYDGYFEDWVFWIDLLLCGYRGLVIKEPLIKYRIHKNSLGATHKPGFQKMLATLHEDKNEFFGSNSPGLSLDKYLNRRILIQNNSVNLLP